MIIEYILLRLYISTLLTEPYGTMFLRYRLLRGSVLQGFRDTEQIMSMVMWLQDFLYNMNIVLHCKKKLSSIWYKADGVSGLCKKLASYT